MTSENELSLAEEQAFQLSQAAINLDNARNGDDKAGLANALRQNLEVWIAIRTAVSHDSCTLTKELKDNLVRLSNFVADKAIRGPDQLTDTVIDSMININLQISEGLLEGAAAR